MAMKRHAWRGDTHPGRLTYCGRTTPHGTYNPLEVTCQSCRRWLEYRGIATRAKEGEK